MSTNVNEIVVAIKIFSFLILWDKDTENIHTDKNAV